MRVEELEQESESLKKELGLLNRREENHIVTINDLENDLHKTQSDIKELKNEK